MFRGSLKSKKRRLCEETRFCDFWSFYTDSIDPNALRTGLWCFGRGAKSSGHLEAFVKTPLFGVKNDGVTVLWQFDKKSQKIDFLKH